MADVVEIDAATGATSERDFTPEELAQRQEDQQAHAAQQAILDGLNMNRETLQTQAEAALASNRIAIAANPANVTLQQVANQVQALSQQNNALIRLVLNLLDGVD